ncbi:7-deoxyloganetin glucosyltransferase, partial [Bienertia sinuspersici]
TGNHSLDVVLRVSLGESQGEILLYCLQRDTDTDMDSPRGEILFYCLQRDTDTNTDMDVGLSSGIYIYNVRSGGWRFASCTPAFSSVTPVDRFVLGRKAVVKEDKQLEETIMYWFDRLGTLYAFNWETLELCHGQVVGMEHENLSLRASSSDSLFFLSGHVGPMLKLAKLLHAKGHFVTIVNTELNHRRLLESGGSTALDGMPRFRFEVVPDWEHNIGAEGIHVLCNAVLTKFLDPFKDLLIKINDQASSGSDSDSDSPPVSLILADCMMAFTLDAAEQLGNLPVVLFWTASAAGFLGYSQYRTLLNKGIVPIKGTFQPFMRITDKDDIMFNLHMSSVERAAQSSAPVVFNSFDAFEHEDFEDLSKKIPGLIFTSGPLHLLQNDEITANDDVKSLGASFWKEDSQCLDWLDTKNPNSVVYVSFESITAMTNENLVEFAWGLANSKHLFLWIVQPNLISGDTTVIPPEFLAEIKDRGLLVSWCDQEKVLDHPSIGAFLMHCGWNSTLDSICGGVPMLCSPFFAEQQTNCWFASEKWQNDEKKSRRWKKLAEEAAMSPRGSSYINFDKLINQALLPVNQQKN